MRSPRTSTDVIVVSHGVSTAGQAQLVPEYDNSILTIPCSTAKVRYCLAVFRRSNTCYATEMTPEKDVLLDRLYRSGVDHDAVQSDRTQMFLNITPATGQFLALLLSEMQPKRILEIGTSNGYSTMWLARAASAFQGRIVSIEQLLHKSTLAQANLTAAGLSNLVDLVTVDAGTYLADCDDCSFGFVFLDASRSHYAKWWPNIRRIIDWGILVVDNAISHAYEMRELIGIIRSDPQLNHTVLPIGKGELVVTKALDATSHVA